MWLFISKLSPLIIKFIKEVWWQKLEIKESGLSMEVKDNQDLSETSQVALVNEWLNKDSNFNFEVVDEGEHNLEEFTKENTKQ